MGDLSRGACEVSCRVRVREYPAGPAAVTASPQDRFRGRVPGSPASTRLPGLKGAAARWVELGAAGAVRQDDVTTVSDDLERSQDGHVTFRVRPTPYGDRLDDHVKWVNVHLATRVHRAKCSAAYFT